ncbi:MAG: hypothetical protein Q8O55_06630 [Dehalococcoidales bacterium]|nr:hypothetical protein [Dehalococcoidales bacterium]
MPVNKCQSCGHEGPDVHWRQYSNETLHWWVLECTDSGDCFRRFHAHEEAELEKLEKGKEV